MKFRVFLVICFLVSFNVAAAEIEVYKSPTCGCCQKWVDALKSDGHDVVIHHMNDLQSIKQKAGLPFELGSCHTGFVEGYVLEGHVPLQEINKLLEEKPSIKGLAVPGMPAESLGMEVGRTPSPYTVYSFDNMDRITSVAEYKGSEKIK
jgi:hypothetical protein